MKILVATRSRHKVAEIREILADVPDLEVLDLDDAGVRASAEEEHLEPYETFEENAVSKARYFFGLTGLPTVADDSGIEVRALGDAPGVRSKRFAPGEGLEGLARDLANNRYLLERLRQSGLADRRARYVCVAAFVEEGREPLVFRGEAPGSILDEPRGEGGFGYDPHVLDPEIGLTFAEMPAEEKNRRSHRAKAFSALAETLRARSPGSSAVSSRDPRHQPRHVGPTPDGTRLRIEWGDGAVSELEPRALRLLCPCAGCVDEMTGVRTLRPESVDEGVYPTAIHYVGRYALQFVWSDGHSTGIYTFEYLRELGERQAS